jgi:urea carboxylase
VYLGAPVATPLDPRHRLVTTKYNPARTWTPENAVGIGGAYLCIYGMEGPGGYQLVGRTVPVWNRFRSTKSFEPGIPWLLRFFDQIRFYPVSHEELQDLRADILTGKFEPRIEHGTFRFAEYETFLQKEAASIASFRAQQQAAFAEERERWKAAGADECLVSEVDDSTDLAHSPLAEGLLAVTSPAAGSVWKILVAPGQSVKAGETVALIESMKMEIPCVASASGVVREILATEGRAVSPGQILIGIEP